MESTVTKPELAFFLQDFENNSETSLVEGEEKEEIYKIAEARDILLKECGDIAGFKTIYTFADKANNNGVRLPEDELKKALPTMIGKPVNINHNRRFVVGHYIDYRYIEKEKKVIAYGIYYKSNFKKEWNEFKKLLDEGKLSTSYEIWCPPEYQVDLPDGTKALTKQEIAGGALVYEDEDTKPAFDTAKVQQLVNAIENVENKRKDGLFYSKKYNKKQTLFYCSEKGCVIDASSTCDTDNKEKDKTDKKDPTDINFSLICPNCEIKDWTILNKSKKNANIKCSRCGREYKITYAYKSEEHAKNILNHGTFLYTGVVNCYQCHKSLEFFATTSKKSITLTCDRCGLTFSSSIEEKRKRRVISIEEINKDRNIDKGGKKMSKTKDTKKVKSTDKKTKSTDKLIKAVAKPKLEKAIDNTKKVNKDDKVSAKEVFKCECLECSEIMETEKHCRDIECPECGGEMRRVERPGPGQKSTDEDLSELSKKFKDVDFEKASEDEMFDLALDIYYSDEDVSEEAKEWTTKYINNLPDSAFAKIEPAYAKEETEDKNARHLPHHNKSVDGSVSDQGNISGDSAKTIDLDHYRNARARVNQIKPITESITTEDLRNDAKKHLNQDSHVNTLETKPEESKSQMVDAIAFLLAEILDSPKDDILGSISELSSDNSDKKDDVKEESSVKVEKYAKAIRDLVREKLELQKALDSKDTEIEKVKSRAKVIVKRREKVGNFGKDLSDDEILNDDKFEIAKLKKENTQLKKSKDPKEDKLETATDNEDNKDEDDTLVGSKKDENLKLSKDREDVDRYAFPLKYKNKE